MKTVEHTEKEKIEAVIRACDVCFVGMAGADGIPYVLPMNFGYADGVIYLHSAQEGGSIAQLRQNPNVCIVFQAKSELVYQHPDVACSYRMRSKSVMAWGKVAFEEDFDRKTEALNILMSHYSDRTFRYARPAVENVKIWRVAIEKITCREFGVPHERPS
ncbi:MAG: pyridoxamine 5'-phosphate oxidase family protein [Tannerella sp.]|jgi:nitroimidazol reductase NimA-like FMN-containing flavoprotein (pyridoxamine 5'-phosphate oxidase superfamily)|nr:pyridoxamine 5'-phosphate oxidase family protein [Tannerella sp.]